jgi:iron complex outermembrane receptor protein
MPAHLPGTPVRARLCRSLPLFLSCCVAAFAQTAPTPPASTTSTTTTEPPPVELSPFEVRAENDVGYQAGNTTSGSRLNSRLKDTPASVSAFTPEFLSDIAATNLEEMLAHATNVEIDMEDSNAGFNNPQGRGADGNDMTFRMRGSPGGASRDFVESSIPVDLYNVERAEVASGPNSILFGLGQAGGLVSLTGKKANLTRQRTTLKSMFGRWNYERYEGDHNMVLVPRKLSVRLLGLYQNSEGWRHWDFNDQARWTTAIGYQPFRNTTIHASFEKGHMDTSLTMAWNATDQITGWEDGGRRIFDGTAAQPGTSRLNANNNRYTFNQQDGITWNLRGEFESNNRYGVETLMPPSVVPYSYSHLGPGGTRHQTFNTKQVTVSQRLPRHVTLELAYFKNTTDVEALGMPPAGGNLRADPNLTLPRPDGAAGTLPNQFAGRMYFDANWFKDWIKTSNEIGRLTAAWEVGKSERWFGRHRIAGLLENSEQVRRRRWRNETLVDQDGVPITNATNAEGAQNQVFRRFYVTPNDFTTYYPADPTIPIPQFTIGNRTFHSTYVSRARANTHTIKEINTVMFASQSFWLKDRLVTTLGARKDDIKFRNEQEERVLDRNNPLVRSGEVSTGEWFFNGDWLEHAFKPSTFTAGAVLHATKRLSVFYNMSKNSGQPRFDREVLPTGDVGPPTEGRGRDLGFMLDVFGDDRLFIRTTWFETRQINDTPILPGANALGVDNLATMVTALDTAGKISAADRDKYSLTWTTATIDVFTEGLEVEVVANPTKSLSLRASYSNSKRRRENFFREIFQFFDERVAEWRPLLANNPAERAMFDQAVAEFESEMAFQVDRQNSPFSSRPHKMNGTARYTFREGFFKGGFMGGSIRYNGKNFMSWDRATGYIYWGNESLLGDAFAGYRFKVPRTKINATVQLNVKNVTNSYLANPGRYNDNYTGLRRVYLQEPRSWRLTTTLDF